MGMFDTVHVPCPTCGKTSDFQSKSGDCTLAGYKLDEAPDDVLMDVNRHSPQTCQKCGTRFGVRLRVLADVVVWPSEETLDDD